MGFIPLDLVCIAVVAAVLIHAYTRKGRGKRRGLPLPPGPPGLPVLGNLLDMPKQQEWVTYHDWSLKYGSDIVSATTFGTHLIVINSARAAHELLERRSSLYSDRPMLTALMDYMDYAFMFGFVPYGALWRRLRKVARAHFNPTTARAYEPIEERAAHRLLRSLVDTPADFRAHIHHMAGEVIMRIAYGIDIQPHNDPYIALALRSMRSMNEGVGPGALIFDFVPFLQRMPWWFPGAGFKREAQRRRPEARELREIPLEATRSAMRAGTAPDSVAAALLADDWAGADPVTQSLPSTLYLAGADTTVHTISTVVLAMVLHPAAQRRAQAELDGVLGGVGARLPTFADRERLPYLDALIKEAFRWRPIAPLAIPHRVTADNVVDDFFVPAGATVFANTWAILHDARTYPDPEAFVPERFLRVEDGGRAQSEEEAAFPDAAFGFGRRVCPGRHLAQASVWVAVACMLATLDFAKAKDAEGNEIEVTGEYTEGMVVEPKPFECSITPRSERARELIAATGQE